MFGENNVIFAQAVKCRSTLSSENDILVSEESYKNTAAILGELATVKTYHCDHFQIYQGKYFEMCINDQLIFLEKHL
jgi:predicted metallo-beta-lactamase superfamily hydrolase